MSLVFFDSDLNNSTALSNINMATWPWNCVWNQEFWRSLFSNLSLWNFYMYFARINYAFFNNHQTKIYTI